MQYDSICKKWFIFLLILTIPSFSFTQTNRIRQSTERSIFRAGRIIDPASERIIENGIIEINNGRILRVGKAEDILIKEGVKIIDFGDKTIIPGLIDTHGHLFGGVITWQKTCEIHAAFYLAAGVTAVRAPGSLEPEGDIGLQRRIDSGRFLGPRYFNSGPYIEGDPASYAWMQPVATPEEVRLKIDQWIKQGATSVKVYAAMKSDVLKTAIEHGHAQGVKVIGHIDAVSYAEAIGMGIDELFHGILAMPDILPEDMRDLIKKKEYDNFYKSLAEMVLEETKLNEILKLAAEHKVVLTPTAVVIEPVEMERNHMEEQKKYYTPEAWEKIAEAIENPPSRGNDHILDKNKRFIKMAFDAGCILTTGTDQVGFRILPGFSLWREMEIFSEAGLESMEVLKAATINGAYAIGRSDLLGSMEPGKLADFVILDENPLDDISNVRKVHRIVKGGIIYDKEKLLESLIGKYE
jgi:enamidase